MPKVLFVEFLPNGEADVRSIETYRTFSRAQNITTLFNHTPRHSSSGGWFKAFVDGKETAREIEREKKACVAAAVAASKINALQEEGRVLGARPRPATRGARPASGDTPVVIGYRPKAKVRNRQGTGAGVRPAASDVHGVRPVRGEKVKAPIKRKKAPTPEPTSTDMLMRRADPMMRQWYPEHAPKKMRNDYRILVTGSRDWPEKDKSFIERQLALAIERAPASPLNILIITGGADGVDTMTRDLCRDVFGIACAEFSAPWEAFRRKFGNPRSAGPVRNKWMVRWGRPDIVLAFHPYIVKSKGTKNCVEQARKLGIPVRIYTGKETS